jgi:hypothetical protein
MLAHGLLIRLEKHNADQAEYIRLAALRYSLDY